MKIAVIGSGISGLGAAYLLAGAHDVTLYEKNDYAGGHSRTRTITTPEGAVNVDTGFIVFNKRNYPHLVALFRQLKVPVKESDMSFGASIDNGWLEYGTASLAHTFAQRRNWLRPPYLNMVRDILKFHKLAKARHGLSGSETLGDWLAKLKLGPWFRDYFLLPMGGAIWSMPTRQMLDYPAETFIRFFENHGLLGVDDAPQWYTVVGGARVYVELITRHLANGVQLNKAAARIERCESGVEVIDERGTRQRFDRVVLACHSDEALALLDQPTNQEQAVLGAIRYQDNLMVLHSDTSFMPRRKAAWSSWVYLSEGRCDATRRMCVSYWMNNLQPLGTTTPLLVTLNPPRLPRDDLLYEQAILSHPVFDRAAIEAQGKIESIQGHGGVYYCGAWQRFGFHEDGLTSAVKVAKAMGVTAPWE